MIKSIGVQSIIVSVIWQTSESISRSARWEKKHKTNFGWFTTDNKLEARGRPLRVAPKLPPDWFNTERWSTYIEGASSRNLLVTSTIFFKGPSILTIRRCQWILCQKLFNFCPQTDRHILHTYRWGQEFFLCRNLYLFTWPRSFIYFAHSFVSFVNDKRINWECVL